MEHSNSSNIPSTRTRPTSSDDTTAADSSRTDYVLLRTHDYPTVYERMNPSEGLRVINVTSSDGLAGEEGEEAEREAGDEANTETVQDDSAQQQQVRRRTRPASLDLLAVGAWEDLQWTPTGSMQELDEWVEEFEDDIDEGAVELDLEEATREIVALIEIINAEIEALRSDPDIRDLISDTDIDDEMRVVAAMQGRWPLRCPVTGPVERREPEGFVYDGSPRSDMVVEAPEDPP